MIRRRIGVCWTRVAGKSSELSAIIGVVFFVTRETKSSGAAEGRSTAPYSTRSGWGARGRPGPGRNFVRRDIAPQFVSSGGPGARLFRRAERPAYFGGQRARLFAGTSREARPPGSLRRRGRRLPA